MGLCFVDLANILSYIVKTISVLGKGSFGQVLRCLDHCTGTHVAVKIIRNKKRFHQQGAVEVKILRHMHAHGDEDAHCAIPLMEHFVFRNHLCLAFPLLSINLYEVARVR